MLKTTFIFAFALFTIISASFAVDTLTKKSTIALFYADWCGSCKILEPKLEEAMANLENKNALTIVKFDLTDDTTKAAAQQLAAENNLSDLYSENAPKTGFAVLVDGENSIKLTKNDSVDDITMKLNTFIGEKS